MSPLSHRFRTNHLLMLLEGYEQQKAPIDFWVSCYFREHKALGSKDRAFISDEVYRLIRWRALIDHFITHPDWQSRIDWLQNEDPKRFLDNETIPLHIRYSMPEVLMNELIASWGVEKAKSIALACLEPAPTCIRANLLKTTRDQLFERLSHQGFLVSRAQDSETGILFHKKENFFCLPEFIEGLFEVQDEGSQQVAQMVQAKANDHVFDFCAGSGGKTLAFAPNLKGTGQIYLHDIRLHALHESKKRLKRAGIQNAQIVAHTDDKKLRKLKKTMNWVLVDAPCSGTGTLRRNPDMKWKYTPEMLVRIVSTQRVIFEQALSYVKPGGYIVYATCSILNQENRAQLEHFLAHYPIELVGEPFECVPEQGKKDGFFGAVFRKR
ncbi:MAG: RsmB/NOP family class I SAM-dependent RNA methyltransferase [Chlamydiales bacterium]|nr:RsmB/NOP family class I SAM-dependent RNA methyltransferase [Chlamydiales bacterium]